MNEIDLPWLHVEKPSTEEIHDAWSALHGTVQQYTKRHIDNDETRAFIDSLSPSNLQLKLLSERERIYFANTSDPTDDERPCLDEEDDHTDEAEELDEDDVPFEDWQDDMDGNDTELPFDNDRIVHTRYCIAMTLRKREQKKFFNDIVTDYSFRKISIEPEAALYCLQQVDLSVRRTIFSTLLFQFLQEFEGRGEDKTDTTGIDILRINAHIRQLFDDLGLSE